MTILVNIEKCYKMDTSDRLRLLRKTLRLTQTQIASAIKISRSGYASIEMKLTGLTPRNLSAICDTYSVNPKWLEFGEEPMFTEPKTNTEQSASILFSKYNKSEVTQRFLIALEQLKTQGTSYSEVANKIGASTSLVSEIRRGKTFLLPHFAQKFIEIFNINKEWLLEGKGDNTFTLSGNVSNVHPVEVENSNWIEVPFVPLHARASFAETYFDSNVNEVETIKIRKRPGIKYEKAKIFEVDGDSMEPTLVSGEQVLCEIIDPANWKFTTGVVVVAFGNMVVIKRIKDNELSNGKLVLWSDNELGGKITLSNETEEIRRIYKVKYSIYKPIR